jgi:hypothetical protein
MDEKMQNNVQNKLATNTVKASMIVILSMPLLQILIVCMVTGTSLLAIIQEPESFGMSFLLVVFAYIIHSPLFILLFLFIRFIKQSRKILVVIMYALLLFSFILSGLYFAQWFISFPRIRYIPFIIYVLILLPLLSLGTFGVLRQACEKADHKT